MPRLACATQIRSGTSRHAFVPQADLSVPICRRQVSCFTLLRSAKWRGQFVNFRIRTLFLLIQLLKCEASQASLPGRFYSGSTPDEVIEYDREGKFQGNPRPVW